MASTQNYLTEYYVNLRSKREAANIVIDLLLQILNPKSIVDFGCGPGVWLSVFQERGITDILGLDGFWIPDEELVIPIENIKRLDLSKEMPNISRYDLVLCLEVAEHLPELMADQLVHNLTDASDIILFSAALPLQGGTHHINEQWPWYWQKKFGERGFVGVDALRGPIRFENSVGKHYRQNLILYIEKKILYSEYPELAKYIIPSDSTGFVLVLESILRKHIDIAPHDFPMSQLLGAILGKIIRRGSQKTR